MDTELSAHPFIPLIVELLPVVGYNGSGYAKSAYDGSPYEVRGLGLGYSRQGLSLHPLSKIINCNDGIPHLSLSRREWSNGVDPSLSERPGAVDRGQALRWLTWGVTETLALITPPRKLFSISGQGRPEIALADYLVSEGPPCGMVAADPFMDLPEDIIGFCWA